ncbi:Uu.00g035150.m01.CDS01 [Anthostomella pinea]|uniref:Uu.00g035150.m01.CDS01 n=1 Tax=Anthostomella pinea TaxID=933095 RepID=A0AAI8V9P9_9PEZI|nr:Uu.00g035150.m01.CDS01 [Anthostomella pinea]
MVVSILIIAISFLLSRAIYHCFFHQLSRFPGPRLAATTRLQYAWYLWQGRLHEHIKSLHDQHGPVVGIAPDELSFTAGAAWTDIYCGGVGNKGFPKHGAYRNAQTFESLFDADDKNHTRLRRLLRNSFFSMKSARMQEEIVQDYTDKLIQQLRTRYCAHNRPAVLREWYNYLTFDIAGYVVMSEDFGCLGSQEYHPWVLIILSHLRLSALFMILRLFPPLPLLALRIAPAYLLQLRDSFFDLVREKLDRRLQRTLPGEQVDFVQAALGSSSILPTERNDKDPSTESNSQESLSLYEIQSNSILLLLAGSETMATSLLSATHLLCESPLAMARLVSEVRTTAPTEADLNFNNLANMPYLNGVIREAHRLCPPLANGPARVVDRENTQIAGYAVPPGTAVGVTQFATNRCAANFVRPDEFLPERWLSPEEALQYPTNEEAREFGKDRRDVVRPVTVGGRDCIGQNLAILEFRVVLARMVWNFDVEVSRKWIGGITGKEEGSSFRRWTDQKPYMLWDKQSYYVSLKERR